MVALTESEWQAQVIDLAHVHGWRVQHSRPSQTGERWMTAISGDIGFPDLVLAHRRRGVIFAELKSDTGHLRVAQDSWRQAIEEGGGEWHLWRPSDYDAVAKILARE